MAINEYEAVITLLTNFEGENHLDEIRMGRWCGDIKEVRIPEEQQVAEHEDKGENVALPVKERK